MLKPLSPRSPRFRHLAAAALGLATAGAACRSGGTPAAAPEPPVSADTWAVVDGKAITRDDVEKAFRRTGGAAQPLSDDEALAAKLTILNDLVLQDILLAKAAATKIEVPESELDTAYAEARKGIPDDAFQQELTKRNLSAADMRDGLRRELITQKVIQQEVQSKVVVSEQEVTAFYEANRARFNFPEEAYHLAQIVITPVPEGQPANRSGDDAATPQAANAKVQMLMERLKQGTPFGDLAADYSEDPQTAQRGGDLGFVPLSQLKKAPPSLQKAVLNVAPGTVNVVSEQGGHTILLVVAHEQAGQRDLSTPTVRENITNTLRGRREQLLRTAYLTAVRNDAKVTNHLARRLVESQGKVPPTIAPTAPGSKP